ncbi:MAG: hypothetical protein R3C44_21450 [Chloroflexota bacterium]
MIPARVSKIRNGRNQRRTWGACNLYRLSNEKILTPAINVTKTADVSEVTAPGGPVTFTVRVDNTGDVPVTIDYLNDSVFGDITTTGHDDITATTCSLGQTIAVNGNYECTFTATITGNPVTPTPTWLPLVTHPLTRMSAIVTMRMWTSSVHPALK